MCGFFCSQITANLFALSIWFCNLFCFSLKWGWAFQGQSLFIILWRKSIPCFIFLSFTKFLLCLTSTVWWKSLSVFLMVTPKHFFSSHGGFDQRRRGACVHQLGVFHNRLWVRDVEGYKWPSPGFVCVCFSVSWLRPALWPHLWVMCWQVWSLNQ